MNVLTHFIVTSLKYINIMKLGISLSIWTGDTYGFTCLIMELNMVNLCFAKECSHI